MDDIHSKVDRLIQNNDGNDGHRLKRWHWFLLVIVMASLGSVIAIPFFQRKEGGFDAQEHLVDELNKNIPDLGSHPAYTYWYPPNNSFGIGTQVVWNNTWVKNKVKNNVDWMLETNTGVGWYFNNDSLNVGLRWNITGFYKVWFNVTNLPFGSHRITFYSNIENLSSMINKTDDEIWINYTVGNETLRLMFNYSDLKGLGLIFKSGKYNGYWYFRFRRDNFQGSYSFDPTFGYSTSGTAVELTTTDSSGRHWLQGWYDSPASSGTVDNITIRVWVMNTDLEVQCGLYEYVDNSSSYGGNLLGWTEIIDIPSTGDAGYFTFNFSSPPSVTGGTNYYMVAAARECVDASNQLAASSAAPNARIYKYSGCPYSNITDDPLTGESTSVKVPYIYCSYTESGEEGATWHQIFTNNFSYSNTTSDRQVFTDNFSYSNSASLHQTFTDNFSYSNSATLHQAFTDNFSYSNTTITRQTFTDNFSYSNTSVLNWQQTFTDNFSYSNTSEVWHQEFTDNFSYSNTAEIWNQVFTNNFSYSNSSLAIAWHQEFVNNFSYSNSTPPLFTITNEYPTNQSNIYVTQPTVYFNLTHPSGYTMNYSLYIHNTTLVYTGVNVTNGTQVDASHLFYSANTTYTGYYWRIVANDGEGNWVNETFTFQAVLQGGAVKQPASMVWAVMGLFGIFGFIAFFFIRRRRE